MEFPQENILDDFNRADGGLGASWTPVSGAPVIESNQFAGNGRAGWVPQVFRDFDFTITVPVWGATAGGIAVYFRYNAGTDSGYLLYVTHGAEGDKIHFIRRDNGVETYPANVLQNLLNGDRLGIRAVGSTIIFFHRSGGGWSDILTAQDATHDAGEIQLAIFDTVSRLDDFSVSELPPAADKSIPNVVFRCTLTGSGDGLSDIVLPISSFQARRRSGDPSYLSVVIPGINYKSAINARPNGELYIDRVRLKNGNEIASDELIRVNVDPLRYDEGAVRKSITLTGTKQTTNSNPQVRKISDAIKMSRGTQNTTITAPINSAVAPGDTVQTWDTEQGWNTEITVGIVAYRVGAKSALMELSE